MKEYKITVKGNKEAIYENNKRISNWHNHIYPYGLINGKSNYYIAKNENNQEAIFHKDNKDKSISNWHDYIYNNGLIKGASEYYVAENENNKHAIFHKDDKDKPTLPNKAIGYKLNRNLKASTSKIIKYKVPKLKKGDEVKVKIIKIDRANGKVSLSKKALEPSPVSKFAQEHRNGDIVEGTVKDKKDFGIFVSIKPGVDALLRLDDLGPLKEDEIEKGQTIRAVISFLDAKNDRIRISVKRLERQEEREALEQLNKEQDDSMTLGDVFKDHLKR